MTKAERNQAQSASVFDYIRALVSAGYCYVVVVGVSLLLCTTPLPSPNCEHVNQWALNASMFIAPLMGYTITIKKGVKRVSKFLRSAMIKIHDNSQDPQID